MISVKGQLTDQLREMKAPLSSLLNHVRNLAICCPAKGSQ
jgi:hypothetical protein